MRKKIIIEKADRLHHVPPSPQAEIQRLKAVAVKRGIDLIDLDKANPVNFPPKDVVRRMQNALQDVTNQGYAYEFGLLNFRKAISNYMEQRFRVQVDPVTEVLPLIGSKEGFGHLCLAILNPADLALLPDPCYAVYLSSALLAGADVQRFSLLRENGYLPDFEGIEHEQAFRAKLMFLNYPNNPTGATADIKFFEKAVEFAREYNIVICQDAFFSEITFDGYRAPSILQVRGGRDVAVEFHSLSASFNMAGWRIGFAAGSGEIIKALAELKSWMDMGVFLAVQEAACEALGRFPEFLPEITGFYNKNRDILVDGLRKAGWEVDTPKGAYFVWAGLPGKNTKSMDFSRKVLRLTGVACTPGISFGRMGEHFVRFSLTSSREQIHEAVRRLSDISLLRRKPRVTGRGKRRTDIE